MDGGEPRGDQLSRGNIIESNHRKILWNAQLMAPGSLYHTNCQPIAGCQDGRGARFAFKDAFQSRSAIFFVGLGALPNNHREPGSVTVENFKIAFNPPPGYFIADLFQAFSDDETAVSVAIQLEGHDREC